MNIEKFAGSGSTPSRRRFWDAVRDVVISSRKQAGRFVTIEEYQGKGTLISVPNTNRRAPSPPSTTGACCYDDGSCVIHSEGDCISSGGAYQGNGTPCDPDPCEVCLPSVTLIKCGFDDCGASGRKWLTRTSSETWDVTDPTDEDCGGGTCSSSGSTTTIEQYDPFSCASSVISCSGSATRFCENADPQEDDCSWTLVSGACHATPSPQCNGNFFFLCCSAVDDTNTCEDDGLTNHLNRVCNTPASASGTADIFQTVSDEYTTDLLIENTLALLGDCPEGCHVVYVVSEDEMSCTAWCVTDT